MLGQQILRDQQGIPMGVFIPMQTWKNVMLQYPDIEKFDTDIAQWEKDFIDERLNIAQCHPERLHAIENLLATL